MPLPLSLIHILTVTHNETSSGLTNRCDEIGEVIKKYPDVVWCVDAVSSAGGMKIEVDKWGIDVCVTSTQKCLGLPPGLAVCTFSDKALQRAKQIENRGFYLDLLKLYNVIQKKDYQYPSTPSLPHLFALDYQLDCILEEGLEDVYKRQYVSCASRNVEPRPRYAHVRLVQYVEFL